MSASDNGLNGPIGELDREDIERLAGQMVMAGFEGAEGRPPAAIKDALERERLAGVILFSRNVESADQLAELNESLHAAAPEESLPPLIGVDQEGGRVARLREGFTEIPPMWEVAQSGDMEHIAEVSNVMATELTAVGFNLNFAPVLDVRTNPDNEVSGDRAFSSDPEEVGRAARAFLRGHHAAGVVTCGKHFPGHGDTELDSHVDLPVVNHDLDRLRRIEFPPFSMAISAGLPMVMTAHLLARELDNDHPATLSADVLNLLRDELDFDGVIVSDDIEMDALADRYDAEEIVDLGLEAGLDLFLVCHTEQLWRRVHERIVELALDDRDVLERVRRSAARVCELKDRFLKR